MTDLQYIAKYHFELTLPSCNVGKECFDQEIMTTMKCHEKKSINTINWNRKTYTNGEIVFGYEGNPFMNLSFTNELVIGDNKIVFTYEEKSDQAVMLPNIYNYVYMLLTTMKVVEKVNGSFDKHRVECRVMIENNTDCYFYEKYSPLAVDYSKVLKYGIGRKAEFDMNIENMDHVYLLVNRIYQQYKSEQSMERPYVTVIKDSFERMYDGL